MLATALLVATILAADVATGPRLSLSVFYLIPVALVTWRLGRAGGLPTAAVAAFAWTIADVLAGSYPAASAVAFWNLAARFGVLYVVAALLATVSAAMRAERGLAEEAMVAADELRSINEVKDTLLHAVSHDLRGPITAIVGSARSLQRRGELDLSQDDEDTLVDGVLQSGRKLDRIVGDLLDLERLDRGLVEPNRTPTDLAALLARVVDEATNAGQHRVHLEIAEPIEIDVDAGKVERIVDNLLLNAVKHTAAGTPIHVRLKRVDGGALLSVEDEGAGVPDQAKREIFEPFRQGSAARPGVGIGLSLVARFAELHGGRAWVEDRPGGGAAFRVFLPGKIRAGGSRAAAAGE